MYLYIWEFEVTLELAPDFERAYGVEGPWVELFRGAAGYRSTRMVRISDRPRRYLTLDEWDSRRDYEAFRRSFTSEYDAVDRACELLVQTEHLVLEVDGEELDQRSPNGA